MGSFSDDFSSGDFSLWDSVTGSPSVIDDPFAPLPPGGGALTIKLYDLATNELADITPIAFEPSIKRLLDAPRVFTLRSKAGHTLFTTVAGDGYPNLRKGNRKLIVWEAGVTGPIFHGRVTGVERVGTGESTADVTITAIQPDGTDLGYDADSRAGRPVRDATGNFIDPTFSGTGSGGAGVISGPDLLFQILTNSQVVGAESPGPGGEGPLPIDLTTGTFDVDIPPAVDLSCVDTMDWPVLIGDFLQQLVSTGVCDYDMRPVDPTEGLDPYIMVALTAVSKFGSDKSATVHFDYDTGARNASGCRHVEDFTTICNKLYDYLGPRRDQQHWRANITPGSPGTTVDPTDSRTLYGGQFMYIREYDSLGDEASNRPLYMALWNAEQGSRIEPRDLLYITPSPGGKALYDALKDYDVGDIITINVGGSMGISLAATQRVYGFTKTWDRQGVSRVSELLTSADAA